jgi:SAM-dependent methyltransferase
MTTIAPSKPRDARTQCIDWLAIDRCPHCGTNATQALRLPESGYVFGDEHVDFPIGGISVTRCPSCTLVYKTALPSPVSLTRIFERQAGKKWMEPYDFCGEVVELQRLVGDGAGDLLDVGSGSGALLAAWSKRPGCGRRSALDVVQHPQCAERIDGEFIHGLIDAEQLTWSGVPYDVVTLFDVIEHLYAPNRAFRNLRELVRHRGLVVVESGNIDSEWPSRYGINHWWYVRLFEHHVFWCRESLERIVRRHGFRLLVWRELRHKARASARLFDALSDSAQVALYKITPRLYPALAPLLGKYWTQPWSPFTRDHFRAVLRKL